MAAAHVPMFGELLSKMKKVDANLGLIQDGMYYDISELSEAELYKWTSSIIRFSVANYAVDPSFTKDNLLKVYHGFVCFDHYKFVKKLQNQKIWSSKDIFKNMHECSNI